MFETLASVLVGGFLAVIGGALQSYLNTKNNARFVRMEKREDAYLGYIKSILEIKIDNKYGGVNTSDYWDKFKIIQAKLRLYSSRNILSMERTFSDGLYECWECGCDTMDIEKQKDILIVAIRKELKVD